MMDLTAEQAEGIGTFDPAQPVDRLAKVRAEVERLRDEAVDAWLASPPGSASALTWGARVNALADVRRLIDQP